MESSDERMSSLDRVSVMLQSQEKDRRKSALKEIQRFFKLDQQKTLESWQTLNRPLSRLLNDNTEFCREQTVETLKLFLAALPADDKNIVYVLPILSRRLSSQETIETSEEVRLKCLSLLRLILQRYKEFLPAYVEDLTKILTRTVGDNYPLVKRESCECISGFAKLLPRYFYAQSESFVKPVLGNFAHQHHKVRIAAVRTIGDVIEFGNSKEMEEVATPLAERLFDQSAIVRAAVVEVAGRWLVKLRDRYSWWHKILPLVLTGLHDEIEAIRTRAATLWDGAGRLYMEENQSNQKLKDKMDFLIENPIHYPNVERPNLGCRTIAQQNLNKLVGGITLELGDWMADIRVRSAQLLCVLILNVETDVTQHIEKLLPAMYRACNDEDKRVVENAERAAQYMGYFVDPKIYCELVLPTIVEAPTAGHLKVLSSILTGSERRTLTPELNKIGTFLSEGHICQCKKSAYQRAILSCCRSLLTVCAEDCVTISAEIFRVVFTTLSMTTKDLIKEESRELLNDLAKASSLESAEQLYENYVRSLISSFRDCKSWNVHHPESQIFSACLIEAPTSVLPIFDIVLTILEETMDNGSDPELRLKQFILLSEFFFRNRKCVRTSSSFRTHLRSFLEVCVLPGLIWTAGRAAEAVRTAAISCLCSLLEVYTLPSAEDSGSPDLCLKSVIGEDFEFISEKITAVLVSLVDDNAKKTRLYSLRALYLVISLGKILKALTEGHVRKFYPVVLKRLDDGCDDVRYASLEALVEIWSSIPQDYDLQFNRGHVEALYATTLIHLDDPEKSFQEAVLEALKGLAKVHPELLLHKLQNSKTYFRNQEGLQTLLGHCQCLLRGRHESLNKEQTVEKYVGV